MKTVMFIIEFDNGHDDWPWWKPGWHNAPFAGGRFKRFWWWFIAVSWVRMNLRDYNDYVRSGNCEWVTT